MTMITGAEAMVRVLAEEGVDVVFGVPGGAVLPAYDPLGTSPIRHILARHEQGAGHMAEGYAMTTGRPGVVIATSGPGATNLVTPLMNALMDSTPIVAITGQVATGVIGTNAFQEAPTTEITRAATKRNWLVTDPASLIGTLREAFVVATSGRPGPVLVDVPKDVFAAPVAWTDRVGPPAPEPHAPPSPDAVSEALGFLLAAERPVLYVGGGIIRSGAASQLRDLAEAANVPVVTTLMGRGAIPDDHPLTLGMPGMHGVYTATTALQRADLLLAVGVRFDDRVTGDPAHFAPVAKVVHADVDPRELGKIRTPEVGIVGDAAAVLTALLRAWGDRDRPSRQEWLGQIGRWQDERPLAYHQEPGGRVKAPFVIEELRRRVDDDTILASGVGQHQMWLSNHWKFSQPAAWVNSGGLGTMGFAIPAAIGAKVGNPGRRVVAVDGDGCFQMTVQELITASVERIPVVVVVLNNRHLGMVKQWQELFYGGRLSAVQLGDEAPDYVALAESMGCLGLRATTPEEVGPALDEALSATGRPVVVEVVTDPDEHVWPMVVAGGSNDEVLMGPDDLAAAMERRRER